MDCFQYCHFKSKDINCEGEEKGLRLPQSFKAILRKQIE